MPATPTPASDLLRTTHRKIETHLDRLLQALKNMSADRVPVMREDFLAIQRLASVHFDQEEGVFYPKVRPKAPEVLAKMEEQHSVVHETEHYLGELLESFPASPTQRQLDELRLLGIEFHDAIQCHIVDEEDHLLKFADRILSSDEQDSLAAVMLRIADDRTF